MPPTLNRVAVRSLVRCAMKRGVPREEAEDIVAQCWEKASNDYQSDRGAFEALLNRMVERAAIDWWRDRKRWERVQARLKAEPRLVSQPTSPAAESNQRLMLEKLTVEERRLFAAWALQKHLPQGSFSAKQVAETVDIPLSELNNAKKRLKTRIVNILNELGLETRELWSVAANEGPRRKHHG